MLDNKNFTESPMLSFLSNLSKLNLVLIVHNGIVKRETDNPET
jgi:hypothetical protein